MVAPDALAVAETLALFSADRGVARRSFARFVADGAEVSLPESKQQLFLGDDKHGVQALPESAAVFNRSLIKRRQLVFMLAGGLTGYLFGSDQQGAKPQGPLQQPVGKPSHQIHASCRMATINAGARSRGKPKT